MKNLISFADITAHTVISIGSEPHKLNLAVPLAQGRHLRPLLGLPLFDELLTFADSAPDAPATRDAAALAEYDTALAAWRLSVGEDPLLALLTEVKPMLSNWTVVEAWPSLLGHITAAGLVLKTGKSEGTTAADEKLANTMFSGVQSLAIYHGEELDTWLKKNRSTYAEFLSQTPAATGRLPIGGICFG